MTAREVVALTEEDTDLDVPPIGDTYTMPRDLSVTGNISVTGTVDGRDVAADGALAASASQPGHTHSAGTSAVLGTIKLEDDGVQAVAANTVSATASRTYGLQVNASGQGVVNVPWTDNDTIYTLPLATTTVRGGIELGDAAQQTTAQNAVTTTAARTYAVQINAAEQAVVNVPWTDTVYSLPLATTTVPGGVELFSDTDNPTAANTVSSTAARTYGLQLNAADQGVVNVPWTDTVYTLPLATSTVRGGIELGDAAQQTTAANAVTTTASRTYALQINAAEQGVVNVPWTDTVYSLPAGTTAVLGGIKLNSDTVQTTAANAVTTTASRTYGVQVNASGQGVVNVPWSDSDTIYSLPLATTTVRGGIELGDAAQQTTAANAVTTTASRTYAVQINAAEQAVVNVPWTGTLTSIIAGTLIDVSGTTDITVDVDLSEAVEGVYDPAVDYLLFLDGGVTGTAGKESGADFATALAGVGLAAATGVLALDFSELTDMTADISGTTEFILQNGTTESRKTANEIKLSAFVNDIKPIVEKSISLEYPSAAEDATIFFTNRAITITEMRAVVLGTTPSVTWTIKHGTDRDAAGAAVVTAGTTTTSKTSGSDVVSFNDATIVADSFVWIETTAMTGTTLELHVTIIASVD